MALVRRGRARRFNKGSDPRAKGAEVAEKIETAEL